MSVRKVGDKKVTCIVPFDAYPVLEKDRGIIPLATYVSDLLYTYAMAIKDDVEQEESTKC
jgi:hypothetical protein